MVGGVGVLLDEEVSGRHDVHHDHLHGHAAGEHELGGEPTRHVSRTSESSTIPSSDKTQTS